MAQRGLTFRRVALGCGGLLVLALVLVAIVAGYVWHLWRSEPAGWTRVQAMRQAQTTERRESLAVGLENRLVSALSLPPGQGPASTGRSRESAPYDVEVEATEEEVNAWLEHRLRPWAANQQVAIPAGVRGFGFWIEEGLPVVAARIETADLSQTVSAVLDPEVRPDGRVAVGLAALRAGQLPVPVSEIARRLRSDSQQGAAGELQQALDALEGQAFDPSFPIDRSRMAKLTALEVEPDGLRLKFHVEPRER